MFTSCFPWEAVSPAQHARLISNSNAVCICCSRPISTTSLQDRLLHSYKLFVTLSATMMRGQQLFTASSEVLQETLLPRLSAVDLARLGLTCKDLRAWVLRLPPVLWQVILPLGWPTVCSRKPCLSPSGRPRYSERQRPAARLPTGAVLRTLMLMQDAPRDATRAHLATLTSTASVMTALQRACKARHCMVDGSPPVEEHTHMLDDQCNRAEPHPGCVWGDQVCDRLVCSPCGRFLAVKVERPHFDADKEMHWTDASWQHCDTPGGYRWRHFDGYERLRTPDLVMYEVQVYSISEGFQQLASFCTGMLEPTYRWSSGGHLCVAQMCNTSARARPRCKEVMLADDGLQHGLSIRSAAFVWDPRTCSVLHTLKPEVSNLVRKLAEGGVLSCSWAPSCQYLIIQTADAPSYRRQLSGRLIILDVMTGAVVAQSSYVSMHSLRVNTPLAAMWHPRSHGFVIEAHMHVQDVTSMKLAGLAIGILPAHLLLHSAGFAGDAGHLLAFGYDHVSETYPVRLLSCSIEGQQISLLEVQTPAAQFVGRLQSFTIGWLPGSSTLFCDDCGPVVQLFHLQDFSAPGATSDPVRVDYGPGLISPSGKLFFMFKHGGLVYRVQAGLQTDAQITNFWRKGEAGQHRPVTRDVAWMPTGLGVVMSLDGEPCTDPREGYMPPALHLKYFAKARQMNLMA